MDYSDAQIDPRLLFTRPAPTLSPDIMIVDVKGPTFGDIVSGTPSQKGKAEEEPSIPPPPLKKLCISIAGVIPKVRLLLLAL